MADWKQITARIRRARSGKDPVGQLSNLFQKTRDAMVAFELARHFENLGLKAEAAKWYSTASERFRRADWKVKAQEAAARLGAEVATVDSTVQAADFLLTPPAVAAAEAPAEETTAPSELPAPAASREPISQSAISAHEGQGAKRGRRGRRGGRNRRRGGGSREAMTVPGESVTPPGSAAAREGTPALATSAPAEITPERGAQARDVSRFPAEPAGEIPITALKGRYGDPGVSSRLSLLEMQFRRLLSCPPAKISESERAPVGPGVFLLTDSDLTSNYYVEACQTLRVAIANLTRGSSSRRGAEPLKKQLAAHLGIAETRVGKYLADHCVVRWLQLDDDASHFAHFVVAVLRPALNE